MKNLSIFLLSFLLVACGGGGGGGGGGGSTPPPPSSGGGGGVTPINYSGTTDPADFQTPADIQAAEDIVIRIMPAAGFAGLSLYNFAYAEWRTEFDDGSGFDGPVGTVFEGNEPCFRGGTLSFNVQKTSATVLDGTVDFSSCGHESVDLVVGGSTADVLINTNPGTGQYFMRLDSVNLNLTFAGEVIRFDGSIGCDLDGSRYCVISGTFRIGGVDYRVNGMELIADHIEGQGIVRWDYQVSISRDSVPQTPGVPTFGGQPVGFFHPDYGLFIATNGVGTELVLDTFVSGAFPVAGSLVFAEVGDSNDDDGDGSVVSGVWAVGNFLSGGQPSYAITEVEGNNDVIFYGSQARGGSFTNEPPTGDAGDDQTVESGDIVFLTAIASDTDGTVESVTWEQVGGDTVTLDALSEGRASFTAPNVIADEDLTFRAQITDNTGAYLLTFVTVTVLPDTSGDTQTGLFIDAPVSGLNYATATESGITASNGAFFYKEEEVVSFSIGSLAIGEAEADLVVAPIDLVPAALSTGDPRVSNRLRLLQSLDDNCDTTDGINLDSAVITAANAISSLDFTDAVAFEFDADVQSLVAAGGCGRLVDTKTAIAQHQSQLQVSFQPLLEQIVTYTADGDDSPSFVVDSVGNGIALLQGDPDRGESMQAVFGFTEDDPALMIFNEEGFPKTLYLEDGTILVMSNHTPTTVDVAIQTPGNIEGQPAEENFARVELSEAGASYYNFITSLNLDDGLGFARNESLSSCQIADWTCYGNGIKQLMASGAEGTLNAIIGTAHADDATQKLGDGIKIVSGGVKYSVEVRRIVEAQFTSSSNAAAVNKWYRSIRKSVVEKVVWKASLNALGLDKDQQRIADIALNGLKCNASPIYNYANCYATVKDTVLASFNVGFDIGTILYELYEDQDRLDALEAAAQAQIEQYGEYPPALTITSPTTGFKYAPNGNATVSLAATVIDPNGDADGGNIQWTIAGSNVGTGRFVNVSTDNTVFDSPNFTVPVDGQPDDREFFLVEASIADSTGRSDLQQFFIEVGNVPPEVEILGLSGQPNRLLFCDDPVFIASGKAEDQEDGTIQSQNAFDWYLNDDRKVRGSSLAQIRLPCPDPGDNKIEHTITLKVTDSGGAEGIETIGVDVANNVPIINSVSGAGRYGTGENVLLTVDAQFSDGSAAPPSSITWLRRYYSGFSLGSQSRSVAGYGNTYSSDSLAEGIWFFEVEVVKDGAIAREELVVQVGEFSGDEYAGFYGVLWEPWDPRIAVADGHEVALYFLNDKLRWGIFRSEFLSDPEALRDRYGLPLGTTLYSPGNNCPETGGVFGATVTKNPNDPNFTVTTPTQTLQTSTGANGQVVLEFEDSFEEQGGTTDVIFSGYFYRERNSLGTLTSRFYGTEYWFWDLNDPESPFAACFGINYYYAVRAQ